MRITDIIIRFNSGSRSIKHNATRILHFCRMDTTKHKMVHVNTDYAFWKNKTLPLLIRFYNECMRPEILDSRHNKHMAIRNPRYIEEARQADKKNK